MQSWQDTFGDVQQFLPPVMLFAKSSADLLLFRGAIAAMTKKFMREWGLSVLNKVVSSLIVDHFSTDDSAGLRKTTRRPKRPYFCSLPITAFLMQSTNPWWKHIQWLLGIPTRHLCMFTDQYSEDRHANFDEIKTGRSALLHLYQNF